MPKENIEDDLCQRDFTINALTAPLDDVMRQLEDICRPLREPCLDRLAEFYVI